MTNCSIIIPAYNEEERLGNTLQALCSDTSWFHELIVVDDGSTDRTYEIAKKWTSHVCKLEANKGKAEAITVGVNICSAPVVVFLDADLEHTATYAKQLVNPIINKEADMTVAYIPPITGGLGFVRRLASAGIYYKTGHSLRAPLSGQRALRKKLFQCYRGDCRFGLEVGLNIDCLLKGYNIVEVDIPFNHRRTGKSVSGFWHRFKQGIDVWKAIQSR